ncbi:MAG: putative swib domain-containing protein [Satyrvirus sp.]|uniref:Putative swib domain-containing protein n=1 Tax=Satyrvirus sp. TaxID=2487771 RepID=A0A3G5AE35_9VIRU|nr:MAG: putative swib domain-containing protein [Satyrvirus sp.]
MADKTKKKLFSDKLKTKSKSKSGSKSESKSKPKSKPKPKSKSKSKPKLLKSSKSSHKIVNNKNIESEKIKIMEKLKKNYVQQKKLINDLNKLVSSDINKIKLSYEPQCRINSDKQTEFNKPEKIPESLRKLLKIKEDMLPRSKITELLYQYFTNNKMYDETKKNVIIPNAKIKKIFGIAENDVINFYNLQAWLKKVYDRPENSLNA